MRNLTLFLIISLMFLVACPKVESVSTPPPAAPEQTVTDPTTGEDVTGEYLQSRLEEYFQARDRIFEEARRRIAAGEDREVVLRELMKELIALQEKTDEAIKHIPRIGNVNVPEVFKSDRETLENIVHSDSEY